MRLFSKACLAAALLCCVSATAHASSVVFTATGYNDATKHKISASVKFTENGDILDVDLTNTTVGPVSPGDILTMLLFSLGGADPKLALEQDCKGKPCNRGVAAQHGKDNVPDFDLDSSVDKGAFQLAGNPGGVLGKGFAAREYALGTVAGGIFKSKDVGNANYGIVSSSTDLELNGLDEMTLIRTTAHFQLTGWKNTYSVLAISSVAFAFGEAPDAVLEIPEPASWQLILAGVAAALAARRIYS